MPTGRGDSLGAALLDAIATAAGAPQSYRSYTAKGWHAQLSKLTSSDRGYAAAADVGLSATARTLRAWLAEQQTPSPANRALIARAYDRMAGVWPASQIENKSILVYGEVKIGTDRRTRGSGGHAALLVDGSPGSWARIQTMWQDGDPDPDDVEEAWIEDVLEADLGETTEPWEFPGTNYRVEIG